MDDLAERSSSAGKSTPILHLTRLFTNNNGPDYITARSCAIGLGSVQIRVAKARPASRFVVNQKCFATMPASSLAMDRHVSSLR